MLHTQHPTTIVGIKRYATQLKKLQKTSHNESLNLAAEAAGFQNFRHAQKSLKDLEPRITSLLPHSGKNIYLSAYWKDKKDGTSGQELITVRLSVDLTVLHSPKNRINSYAISSFRNSGPDHLEYKFAATSQAEAREKICKAIRVLQFVDATKLRPSSAHRKVLPKGDYNNAIPGQDHASVWYDSISKGYVLVDEPYEAAAAKEEAKRSLWAERHGQVIRKSKWRGMYYPEMCQIFLISSLDKGVPLDPIIQALDSLPAAMTPELWSGETIPALPPFISPGAIAKDKKLKAKPRPKPTTGPLKTVQYSLALTGLKRRPKTKVSLEVHKSIGSRISSILMRTYERKGIYNSLNSVRCELDNWVQCEYPSTEELSMQDFNNLYYSSSKQLDRRKYDEQLRLEHFVKLKEIKKLLTENYPDCEPLRKLIKLVKRAESSLESWNI